MRKLLYCIGISVFFAACVKKAENKEAEIPAVTHSGKTSHSGMYIYEQNGDTVTLNLAVNGGKANGELLYALKEKDRNSGTFTGEIKDDVLLADYMFRSEGVLSERQVAFKLTDTTAMEGYGEVQETNGKMEFQDSGKLEYDTGLVLKKK